ncbi:MULTISPECIES: M48 family metallopeptidase [Methylococcus]|uniref:M48 family metallopeptidase n=1 Tax=Methylococcus capsulatus TaxID=414 RepID=A0ABZ2F811_METCP|nr:MULTISPECIES: SprT family zinc-dependent metalloprotease [Methylococcus]MDF9390955.1 M48 family peptidase [Methylococcus capsulatus]
MEHALPPYRLRRSPRAKYLRLLIRPDGIEVVAPAGLSDATVLAFVRQHSGWAQARLEELRARLAGLRQSRGEHFPAEGGSVPLEGRETPLFIEETAGSRIRISLEGGGLRLILPQTCGAERDRYVRQALFGWMKRRLPGRVTELIERHAPLHGLYPRQLRIKSMRTRWGSCGPANDVNLNWLLGLAPLSVLEYVVVHELCHIRHRNHSRDFWELVAAHLPNWRQERQWLKTHGGGLIQRFDPAFR